MHSTEERACEDTRWGWGVSCRPRREASGETNPEDTWIVDFLLAEMWHNKCVNSPRVWHLVMAARANT